jgi:hypothetical protein
MQSRIDEQRQALRASDIRPQFPAHYVQMAEEIAEWAETGVSKEIIDSKDHPLHDVIVKGPFLGVHFRLSDESLDVQQYCADQMQQVQNFLQARKYGNDGVHFDLTSSVHRPGNDS